MRETEDFLDRLLLLRLLILGRLFLDRERIEEREELRRERCDLLESGRFRRRSLVFLRLPREDFDFEEQRDFDFDFDRDFVEDFELFFLFFFFFLPFNFL